MQHRTPERTAQWLALAGCALAAGAVQAAEPAAAPSGVMTFPNVRVESLAQSGLKAPAARTAATQGGMRAYVDPATGQFIQPTAEQAAALEAAGSGTAARQAAGVAAEPRTFAVAGGGVGMEVDMSLDSYFVATKLPGGKVSTACVPAEQAARIVSKSRKAAAVRNAAKVEVK